MMYARKKGYSDPNRHTDGILCLLRLFCIFAGLYMLEGWQS
jgi:hypothetical protein